MINKIIDAMKSNPHIEIIEPNLWAVNFDYVLNGWIDGLKFHHTTSEAVFALAEDIIILNSNKPIYKKIIPILKYIMNLQNKTIGQAKNFYNWIRNQCPSLKNNTDEEIMKFLNENRLLNDVELYVQLTNLEIERRKINKKERR